MKRLATVLFFGVAGLIASSGFSKELEVFKVTVNYDLRLEAAIQAGKYDYVNENITEKNFWNAHKGTAELDIVLVHLDRKVSYEEAIQELHKRGLRPAKLKELLAFGAKYLDEQKYIIVALGTVWWPWYGARGVVCLFGSAGGRFLDLADDFADGEDYRFAGVRK